jgi:tetratricopeptide (TPR) repeat protein
MNHSMPAQDISAVREELDRILSSALFARSPRISRFLRYVVEQTLEGKTDRIKEYVIAIEVFDKREEYDPQADSTVRTEATKLRARLTTYYATEGLADRILITVPKGTYVPVLEDRRPTAGLELAQENNLKSGQVQTVASKDSSTRQRLAFASRSALIAASVCLLLAVLAIPRLPLTRELAVQTKSRQATTDSPRTRSAANSKIPDAQAHYVRAKHFTSIGTVAMITNAIDEYLLCLGKDPGFAPAYADLSISYSRLIEIGTQRSRDLPTLASVAAAKAVELDDSLAAAHHATARAQLTVWNWKSAEVEFVRALQLDPSSTAITVDYASLYLNMMGRYDDSLELLRQRLTMDPTSRILRTAIGGTFVQACRYDEALRPLAESLELEETPGTLTHMGIALAAQGRYEEAIQCQQRARVLNPKDTWILGHLAYTFARSGRIAKAKEHLQELREMVRDDLAIPVELAGVYSGLGDREQAFLWLKRGMEVRSQKLRWLGVDQRFLRLHGDQRFTSLLRAVGLPHE